MTALLDPFLYEFVAEHQRTLHESARRVGNGAARRSDWWRWLYGVSTPTVLRALVACGGPAGSRRLSCSATR
jgi:hypothetical protein